MSQTVAMASAAAMVRWCSRAPPSTAGRRRRAPRHEHLPTGMYMNMRMYMHMYMFHVWWNSTYY